MREKKSERVVVWALRGSSCNRLTWFLLRQSPQAYQKPLLMFQHGGGAQQLHYASHAQDKNRQT